MKQKFIDYYMDVADRTSKLSHAVRLQVGAVIVKDNRILSYGYNGMPAGWDNNCEDTEWCSAGGWLSTEEITEGWPYEGHYMGADGYPIKGRYRLKTKPEVLHAETNAIAKVSGSTESSENATMFCTHAPCLQCAKLIYQSGINTLYYRNTYRDDAGLEFLTRSRVNVNKYSTPSRT